MLPHTALILTTLLKDEFDFDILDANARDLSEEDCAMYLRKARPRAVLVSALSVEYCIQYHRALDLAKEIDSDVVTILGGVYPTVLEEEAVKDPKIDYIFIGHAEERLQEFLHLVIAGDKKKIRSLPGIGFRDEQGKAVINPVKSYIQNVKNLVKLDYSLIDVNAYVKQDSKDYQFNSSKRSLPIITSYGCNYNCLFCATRTISGRGVAYRPANDIFEEIEFLKERYNVENLIFFDDCLLGDRKRIDMMLKTFIERRYNITWKVATVSAWHLDDRLLELMKRSGCIQITVSIESGSPRVLHEIIRKPLKLEIIPGIVKKCKELEIDLGANFVIGFPGETWDEIRQSFRFAEICDFDLASFHIATPLPKTDLYRIAKEKGLIPSDFSFTDPRYFGFGQGFITTDEFTPQELMILRAFEWDRINFNRPEKIVKIARMMNLTIEELNDHRKQTRLKCGIHIL
jgi:radical SAM superfamily enzyme YgiQ (UPF0313 family)